MKDKRKEKCIFTPIGTKTTPFCFRFFLMRYYPFVPINPNVPATCGF